MTPAQQQAIAARVVAHLDHWPDIAAPGDHWLIRCLVGTAEAADVDRLRVELAELPDLDEAAA